MKNLNSITKKSTIICIFLITLTQFIYTSKRYSTNNLSPCNQQADRTRTPLGSFVALQKVLSEHFLDETLLESLLSDEELLAKLQEDIKDLKDETAKIKEEKRDVLLSRLRKQRTRNR